MFRLRCNEVMGVDIGSSAVKIVQLRQTQRGWLVTAAGIVEISREGADNAASREAKCLRAITDCLRLMVVKTKLAVCGVGGPEVVVRNFDFPAVPAAETERAVQLEAKQVSPFNTDEIAVDYRLIGNRDGRRTGYLVVATDKLVRNKARLAKKAQLDCTLIDVDGLALLNCFTELETPRDNHGTAILCIGDRHTTLAIEGKNGCPFVRDLNCTGDGIIREVSAENDLSAEALRAMLAGDPQEVHSDVRQSFENACGRLIHDITNTVRYYGAQDRSSSIQKILVCGGFALFGELVRFLDSQLPMELELWNPFEKMQCQIGWRRRGVPAKEIPFLRRSGPVMAVAAGLAMRSI